MEDIKLVQVYSVSGQLQGQMIRIFLESKGISAFIEEESAATVYGLGVGPLAEAKLMVPEAQSAQALEILAALDRGDYALPDEVNGEQRTSDEVESEGEAPDPRQGVEAPDPRQGVEAPDS
jgi:hypothetical protein